MKLISIKPSTKPEKKYMATFETDNGRTKTTHFGQAGATDFIRSGGDVERKNRYLKRHEKNESWNKPDTAGSLSKNILWGPTTSIKENIAIFKKKFNL